MFLQALVLALGTSPGPSEIMQLIERPRVGFEWIVEFEPDSTPADLGVGKVLRQVGSAYVMKLSDAEALVVSNSPLVSNLAPNLWGRLSGNQNAAGGAFSSGLNRLDQRGANPSGGNSDYQYSNTGRGVTIYVIDDALIPTHVDFRTLPWERLYFGADRVISNAFDATLGAGFGPQSNHGTQMASIAAGLRGGTAKGATIKLIDAVRTTPQGEVGLTLEDAYRAIDWILNEHQMGPGVVNMSFEFPRNSMLNNKVQNLISLEGLVVVAAAGNGRPIPVDASSISPASVAEAITVGNLNQLGGTPDTFFSSSNFGSAVDLLAPGVSINAANNSSNTAYSSFPDGTSQSAAAVSGIVARYLETWPAASPATVHSAVLQNATSGAVQGTLPPGTPNLIAFADFTGTRLNSGVRYGTGRDEALTAVKYKFVNGQSIKVEGGNWAGGGSTYGCSSGIFLGGEGVVRRYVNGAIAWTRLLRAPLYDGCSPRGFTDVADVEIDQNGDVLLAVNRYSGFWLGFPDANAYLIKLSAATGDTIQEVQVGGNLTAATAVGNADSLARPVLVGWTNDTIPGTTPIGAVDGFIARFSAAAKPTFDSALKFGSSESDYPTSLVVLGAQVFVAGQTFGLIGGATSLKGSSAIHGGGSDAFANQISINVGPSQVRTLQFGGAADDVARAIALRGGSGLVLAGETTGTLAVARLGGGGTDAFVVGLTTSLAESFPLAQFGSVGTETVDGVYANPLGTNDIYVLGSTTGNISGNNPGGVDLFVTKYSGSGGFRWDWQSRGVGDERGFGFAASGQDSDGEAALFAVGRTTSPWPVGAALGGSDAFSVVFEGY